MDEQWSFKLIEAQYLRGLDFTNFGFWLMKMNIRRFNVNEKVYKNYSTLFIYIWLFPITQTYCINLY